MEVPDEAFNVPKSRLSLAEAVSQLEIAKQAFTKTEAVHGLIEKHQIEVNNLKSTVAQLASISFLNSQMDEMMVKMEKTLRCMKLLINKS